MRLRRYRYAIYIAALLIVLLALFERTDKETLTPTPTPLIMPSPSPSPSPTPTPSPTPSPTPIPTPYVKPIPKKLFFPKYDIESHIFPVGVTKTGNVGTVNSALDTAWFSPYAAPGEEGNAILNGHVSWKKVKGHFSKLMDMEIGDEVFIQFEDESVKYFEITEIEYAGLDEFPPEALEKGGEPRMTLITCKGDFDRSIGTSRTRVIAVCKEKEAPDAPFSPPPLLPPEKTPTLGK